MNNNVLTSSLGCLWASFMLHLAKDEVAYSFGWWGAMILVGLNLLMAILFIARWLQE